MELVTGVPNVNCKKIEMHCLWQKAHLMQHSLHRELPEHIISARLQVGQQRLPGRAGKHFSRHLRAAHFLLTTHAVTRTVQLLSANHQSKAANKSCLKETRKWVTVTYEASFCRCFWQTLLLKSECSFVIMH